MFKNLSYLWMAIAILLVQIFLLDELSIAMWLRPMIFPLIVLLLPMEWKPIWALLTALAVGLTMDLLLGGAGLYTATLTPIAMLRRSMLYVTTKRSVEHGDQTSVLSRLRPQQTMFYIATMVAIHHTLFFVLEALSLATLLHLIATIIFSTLLSTIIAWPIVKIFTLKIIAK